MHTSDTHQLCATQHKSTRYMRVAHIAGAICRPAICRLTICRLITKAPAICGWLI